MDISNLTQTGSVTPSAAKVTEVVRTNKPATQGNSLPELPSSGQLRTNSEKPQAPDSVPILSTEELSKLVGQANDALSVNSSNLKFTVADGTDTNIIRIEDSVTGELIRQIPSETALAIARAFDEIKQGVIVAEKV